MWLRMAEDSGSNPTLDKLVEPTDPTDPHHEKMWWQSKKFIAFMAPQLGFFVLMGAMIYEQEMSKIGENVTFMVLAVTSGFLATGYILGQAALDKFIRVAKITMGKGLLSKDTAPVKVTEPDEEKDEPAD